MKTHSKQAIEEALTSINFKLKDISSVSLFKLFQEKKDDKYVISNSKLIKFILHLGYDYREYIDGDRITVLKQLKDDFLIEGEKIEKGFFATLWDKLFGKEEEQVSINGSIHGLPEPQSFADATKIYDALDSLDCIEFIDSSGPFNISSGNKLFFTGGENPVAVDVAKEDNIWLRFECPINTNYFILLSAAPEENMHPVGFGSFYESNGSYYLEAMEQNLKINYSSLNKSFKLLFSNKSNTRFYMINFEFIKEPLPLDDSHFLCIDFGTSNTTAGTWSMSDDGTTKKELVIFDDISVEPRKETYMLPSCVYISWAKSLDPNNTDIKMLFGYEAQRHLIKHGYDVEGSLFYSIKQWIAADSALMIDCKDEHGQAFKLSSEFIIEKYLRYVLQQAEIKLKRRFVKFHFSAPVKLKVQFNKLVNRIFKPDEGYYILPEDESLDEGAAIIYESLMRLRNEYEQGNGKAAGNVMIIDCGGGTTDVVSCDYKFNKTSTGTKAIIKTHFENGQNNFGGNDITYRIFQLLKIKLKDYYLYGERDRTNIVSLMNSHDSDYLTYVDEFIKEIGRGKQCSFNYYDKLDAESYEAEWVIPTDYANSEVVDGIYMSQRAKRNFNFIWQWAEKIKIAFFSDERMASYFPANNYNVMPNELMYFFVDKTNSKDPKLMKLEKTNDIPDIEINNKELAALLSPQIYYILSTMLLKPDGTERSTKELDKKIRFSGQSCKITLFGDLLKEFIPGKRLRGLGRINESSEKMKLACVNGCISYLMEREYGRMITKIDVGVPNMPYTVKIDKGSADTQDILLNSGLIKNDSKRFEMPQIKVNVRASVPGKLRVAVYNNIVGTGVPEYSNAIELKNIKKDAEAINDLNQLVDRIISSSIENLKEYSFELEGKTENVLERLKSDLRNQESGLEEALLIFAMPSRNGCGFILWQIVREIKNGNRTFYITGEQYMDFQKVEIIKSRFDGRNCISGRLQ